MGLGRCSLQGSQTKHHLSSSGAGAHPFLSPTSLFWFQADCRNHHKHLTGKRWKKQRQRLRRVREQRTRVGLLAYTEQDNSRLLVTDTTLQGKCQVGMSLVLVSHTLGITVLPHHSIPAPGTGPKASNGLLDCHSNNSEGTGCCGAKMVQGQVSHQEQQQKQIKMEMNTRM